MDPPELASEPAPCHARRGRIEPPVCSHCDPGHNKLLVLFGAKEAEGGGAANI
jgi:hypothetical protein